MNGTRTEQEPDNRGDNLLTLSATNPSETSTPAGWRRGYAADCKSVQTGSIPVPASTLPSPVTMTSKGRRLAVYRFLVLTVAMPVLAILLALRLALRRESVADLAQRLGSAPATPAQGPLVWVHAASVGEANAARPLLQALLARDPRLSVLMTANTTTGRAAVAAWGLPRVTPRLAPLDTRRAVRRFLSRWQPAALVTIENEIWPNRIALCQARRIPVLIAGARLSARSAAVWADCRSWRPGCCH